VPTKHSMTRTTLTWCAVLVGITIGLLGLVVTGQASFDQDPNSPVWLTSRFEAFGPGLLGAAFLVASLAALRGRRWAGLLFLASAPVVAFIFSYPGAGFVWKPDGSGVFELPLPSTAVGLACLFYAPFIAPLFAIGKRKRAVFLFLVPAAIAVLVFAGSRWTSVLLPRLAAWSALFLAFGAFWFGTYKHGWPTLLPLQPTSLKRKLGMAFIECLLVGVLLLTGTFAFTVLRATSGWSVNCRSSGLFVKPVTPQHAVFIARLIWVGHKTKVSGEWAGDWAIGVVQERFWGLQPWSPHFVLLTNQIFWEGETVFMSGLRPRGFLTRFLPIVDGQPCLGIAKPVSAAETHLRVLRRPPLANEARIIGSVQSPKRPSEAKKSSAKRIDTNAIYEAVINPTAKYTALAGARILVTGSSGITTVTTDANGIYEVSGLPPDGYTLSLLDQPANQIVEDHKLQKKDFLPGRPIELNFILEWDGSIEGVVRDATGNPAQVILELQNPDGTRLGDNLIPPSKNGSFQFEHLPPSTGYMLMVNPWGPSKDSPYAPVYYPSVGSPSAPRIFEIEPQNPHIRNVDLVVHNLPGRTLQVHALSPDSAPVEGAGIRVAYERTRQWEDVATSPQSWITDRTGLAEIRVFGDFRVRVLAEQSVEDKKTPPWYSLRYSGLVELDTSKMPQKLDLIISSSQVH